MQEQMSIEEFRTLAPGWLKLLENSGFKRLQELEETTPTMATLVYSGEHVAFLFSLDARDQCVDVEVLKVKNGKLLPNCDGGYSSNIFAHLVKHEGYRGGPKGANWKPNISESVIEQAVKGWLNLLVTAGETLLRDDPDSLP